MERRGFFRAIAGLTVALLPILGMGSRKSELKKWVSSVYKPTEWEEMRDGSFVIRKCEFVGVSMVRE